MSTCMNYIEYCKGLEAVMFIRARIKQNPEAKLEEAYLALGEPVGKEACLVSLSPDGAIIIQYCWQQPSRAAG